MSEQSHHFVRAPQALLTLPQERAIVGFTAATGLRWQKHDVLAWHWCDKIEKCEPASAEGFFDRTPEQKSFDYQAAQGARVTFQCLLSSASHNCSSLYA